MMYDAPPTTRGVVFFTSSIDFHSVLIECANDCTAIIYIEIFEKTVDS